MKFHIYQIRLLHQSNFIKKFQEEIFSTKNLVDKKISMVRECIANSLRLVCLIIGWSILEFVLMHYEGAEWNHFQRCGAVTAG